MSVTYRMVALKAAGRYWLDAETVDAYAAEHDLTTDEAAYELEAQLRGTEEP